VTEPTRQKGRAPSGTWEMAQAEESKPSASTPRSRRALTRKPIAQPGSSTVLGWKRATTSSARRPKNPSQTGSPQRYGAGAAPAPSVGRVRQLW
jgi:hypothetical protein